MLALGVWGIQAPLPPPPRTLGATSALIFLRTVVRPDPDAAPTVCRLELDERVWTVDLAAGELQVEPGEPTRADVSVRTDPETLSALLEDADALDAAVADGSVAVTGDASALRRLLRAASPTGS